MIIVFLSLYDTNRVPMQCAHLTEGRASCGRIVVIAVGTVPG